MLFEVLRGCWCNVIVLNVHAPSEETSDVLKDSSCEILEQVFDHRKILFEDFKAKMGGETISKPTNGNESLHQASNDIAVRIVHSATSKNRDINPSAWGHLNPSSYCDVGRLFYGVFKLWSKLQRKK